MIHDYTPKEGDRKMTIYPGARLAAALACLLSPVAATAAPDEGAAEDDERRQYTYSWQFSDDDAMRPRGGTTSGPDVTLATGATDAWQALSEPGLSSRERDRRAILAMAGPYRTSFDFIETVGFVPDYEPSRPYQSWGTEYVYVVADQPEFVSLQHILVMFTMDKDGKVRGPFVVKHWRQDWTYEDRDLRVYAGHRSWEHRRLPRHEVRGAWSQAVYQVDDSPRYETIGRWEHHGNHSAWTSIETWRPLPRREFSVRDDYHVLVGTNRHTITPAGWTHEADNLKLVLTPEGEPRAALPYLAREAGLNRYERIVDHDFSAGDAYWAATGPFWADVRAAWQDLKREHERFTIAASVDDKRLFQVLFGYTGKLEEGEPYDGAAGRAFIDETLDAFVDGR